MILGASYFAWACLVVAALVSFAIIDGLRGK